MAYPPTVTEHTPACLQQQNHALQRSVKVFGLGLSKTGTKTLGSCLEHLGYRHFSWDRHFARAVLRGDDELALRVAEEYDSFDDLPWPALYERLDELYPDAKFVLTVRRDPARWYRSLKRHAEFKGPTEVRKLFYGHTMPHGHKAADVNFYERYNQRVISRFRNRPGKLLVICWEQEPGWDRLCAFLDRPVPDTPIPHLNQRRSRSLRQYVRRVRYEVANRVDLRSRLR